MEAKAAQEAEIEKMKQEREEMKRAREAMEQDD